MKFLNKYDDFKINEFSSDTFKKVINISKERDFIGRTEKLGKLYFYEFIGKPIFEDGIIEDVAISAYKGDPRRLVCLDIKYDDKNRIYHNDDPSYPKKRWINYDIDKDEYLDIDFRIERRDARLLSKIAEKINPDTKYKETGKFFKIKGW